MKKHKKTPHKKTKKIKKTPRQPHPQQWEDTEYSVDLGNPSWTRCTHRDPSWVFKIPDTNANVFAGAGMDGFQPPSGCLVLNLNTLKPVIQFEGFMPGELVTLRTRILHIAWPDGGVPQLTRFDWDQIADYAKTSGIDVYIGCMGGHGRTGTALAILGYLTGAILDDPVEYVRDIYCKECVETGAQLGYIETILGIQVTSELPYKGSTFTTPAPLIRSDPITPVGGTGTKCLAAREAKLSGKPTAKECTYHLCGELQARIHTTHGCMFCEEEWKV